MEEQLLDFTFASRQTARFVALLLKSSVLAVLRVSR